MNVFFDTSSLFKLYHREIETEELMNLFSVEGVEAIYLAEITKIEFSSVVWKNPIESIFNSTLTDSIQRTI